MSPMSSGANAVVFSAFVVVFFARLVVVVFFARPIEKNSTNDWNPRISYAFFTTSNDSNNAINSAASPPLSGCFVRHAPRKV